MATSVPNDAVSGFSANEAPKQTQEAAAEQTVADHILGDQPARCTEDDRLGFKPYVAAVAKFLTHPSTKVPLTMSVEGLWGSGKSSFMRLLQSELSNQKQKRFVTFEAWRYNPDEGLWAAFLDAFDSQLREGMSVRERLMARGRLVMLRISLQGAMDTVATIGWMIAAFLIVIFVLGYAMLHGVAFYSAIKTWSTTSQPDVMELIKSIGGIAGTTAAVLLFFSKLGDLLKSPAALARTRKLWGAPDFHDRMPLIHDMTADLKSLVEAYVGTETVYVFIDDLDRCEYAKAAELIQGLLQLASSAPKVALIVGLDREKVAAAMSAKQEKLLPWLYRVAPSDIYTVGYDYGQRFLEKFIQVSYIVPWPRATGLKSMINPKVSPPSEPPPPGAISVQAVRVATGEEDAKTLDSLIDMADEVFDHNPRNVKQFVNAFRLQAFIASETGLFENPAVRRMTGGLLSVPQLAKFVALCIRWPNLVDAALQNETLMEELEKDITSSPGQEEAADFAGTPSQEKTASGASTTNNDEAQSPPAASEKLTDRQLGTLLRFRASDPDFRLTSVDFRLLVTVAPGRVQQQTVAASVAGSSSAQNMRSFSETSRFEDYARASEAAAR